MCWPTYLIPAERKKFRKKCKKVTKSLWKFAPGSWCNRPMSRPTQLSLDNILRFLQVAREPVSANEIAAALHSGKAARKPLFNMLVKLKKRGSIEELPGGRYRLAGRKSEAESGGKAARSTAQGSMVSGSVGSDSARQGSTGPGLAGERSAAGRAAFVGAG